MVVEMVLVLGGRYFGLDGMPAPRAAAGRLQQHQGARAVIYTDYVYPFEIAAVILLVAIVAAIALTLRRRKDTKYQDPAQQVKCAREDRVRIVSMPAEKGEDDEAGSGRRAVTGVPDADPGEGGFRCPTTWCSARSCSRSAWSASSSTART